MTAECPQTECPPCETLLHSANAVVVQVLDYAGKRMVTRAKRGQMLPVPAWIRHTRMQVWAGDIDHLLSGAWGVAEWVFADRADVLPVLDRYVRDLLSAGQPHEIRYLRAALVQAGITP